MKFAASFAIAGFVTVAAWSVPARCDAPEDAGAAEHAEHAAQPPGEGHGEAPPAEGRPEKKKRVRVNPANMTPEQIEAMKQAAMARRGIVTPSTGPTTLPTTGPTTSQTTTTGPTTAATTTTTTTSPTGIAPTPPFPKEYDLLLKRSMFARGAPKPEKPNAGAAQGPEGNFGLRGVGVQDGQFVALIEDQSAKSSKRVKQGESVATGKIKSIDIDGIAYEANGKTTKVAIGQNLLGAPLPPPPQPAPKQPEQPQGQPGQPGQPGGPQPGQPGGPPQQGRVRVR